MQQPLGLKSGAPIATAPSKAVMLSTFSYSIFFACQVMPSICRAALHPVAMLMPRLTGMKGTYQVPSYLAALFCLAHRALWAAAILARAALLIVRFLGASTEKAEAGGRPRRLAGVAPLS